MKGAGVIAALTAAALAAATLSACERRSPPPPPAPPPPQATAPVELAAAPQSDSPTLRAVRARGSLRCGVHLGLPGFAYPDNRGVMRGMEADLCRAVAAAVLGRADAVQFRRLSNAERVDALRDGRVDLVMRATAWTQVRDAAEGVDFAAVAYYDGQGFLVRRSLNLQSAAELSGARVCVQRGTANVAGLADWARALNLQVSPVLVRDEADGRAQLQAQTCDALTGGVSTLAATRTVLDNPAAYVLLPEVIARRPLAIMVREDDSGWADVVRWTLNALLLAEQLDVGQADAEAAAATSAIPEVRRLLGAQDDAGAALGLRRDWALRAILAVGNYGELFERNVGGRSPLRLQRGLNALWSANPPGLMYALPIGEPDQEPTEQTTGSSARRPQSAQDPS